MALNYSSPFTLSSTGMSSLANVTDTAGRTGYTAKKDTSTTTNIIDTEVTVSVVTPAGYTPSASTFVAVFAVGSLDGTTWPDGMTPHSGSAAITLSTNGNNMVFLGTIPCTAASGTFTSKPFNLAAAFGGVLPPSWAIAIQNNLPTTYSLTSATVTGKEIYYN